MKQWSPTEWAMVGVAMCILFLFFYGLGNQVDAFQDVGKNAMIIVEPRKHPLLQKVIRNFHEIMNRSWDLYVFHGEDYEDYAKQATEFIKNRRVYLMPLGTNNMTAADYNNLFKKRAFWNSIDAENILVFQTDAVLCKKSPKIIDDFLQYDYIGCSKDTKTIGTGGFVLGWDPKHNFYGIGGMSFRKKSFMLKCIERNPRVLGDFPEDVFYSECVADFGVRPPKAHVLNEFCTQFKFESKSLGAHKTQIDLQNKEEFFEYCPEARMLEGT